VRVITDGQDLLLEADAAPPQPTIDALSIYKHEIVQLLSHSNCRWSSDDWWAFFDERAGIAEFSGGLPRPEAEAQTAECCVVEWLTRNVMSSAPGRCLACGGSERPEAPVLPFGTELFGHEWLHVARWPEWHEARRSDAAHELAQIGIRMCASEDLSTK
jgi:hypothetical protein